MRRNIGKRGVLLMTVIAALCTAGCTSRQTDLSIDGSATAGEQKADGQVSDEQKNDADNSENQSEKKSDTQSESVTKIDEKDGETDAEAEIDALIGSGLPLKNYHYYISDPVIKFDIEDYVVEDENEFAVWNEDDLFRVSVVQEKYSDGMSVVPVEIHNENSKYKALRFDDDLYLVDLNGGIEIWKDGKGIALAAECNLGLFHNGRTELSVVDALGNGEKQLKISTYDSGTGYIRQGMIIFDIENMSFVEYEKSDDYFMTALREAVQQYVDDGGEIKDGYKFYLSDSNRNYTGGFRSETEFDIDEDYMYQTLRVDYLSKKSEERSSDTYLCTLKAVYRYDSDKNMFVVDHVEQMDIYAEDNVPSESADNESSSGDGTVLNTSETGTYTSYETRRKTPLDGELEMKQFIPNRSDNDNNVTIYSTQDDEYDIYIDATSKPCVYIDGTEYPFSHSYSILGDMPEYAVYDVNGDGIDDYMLRGECYKAQLRQDVYLSNDDGTYKELGDICDEEYGKIKDFSFTAKVLDDYKLNVVCEDWNINETVDIQSTSLVDVWKNLGYFDENGKCLQDITLSSLQRQSAGYVKNDAGEIELVYRAQIYGEYSEYCVGWCFELTYGIGNDGYECKSVKLIEFPYN